MIQALFGRCVSFLIGAAAWLVIPSSGGATEFDELVKLQQHIYTLRAAGRYQEAIPLAQQLVARAEKAFQEEPTVIPICLNDLGSLYRDQGRYAEAEPLHQRSLKMFEKALGPNHPHVAATVTNLALICKAQGRYAEAEPLYLRSLKIREKALGPDHAVVAETLNNLANLYEDQGRYVEAEPLFQRSLKIREKALGSEHADVAGTQNDLALLYRDQGRYAEAEPLYQRSLKIREKVLGPEHPDVAASLNNLAILYKDQGRYAEAEPLYQRSLKIREKVLGPEHPDVAASLNNLANLYGDQDRYTEAEPLYQRSMQIYEKIFGAGHPEVATSLNNLALLYEGQGRYAKAESLYQRSLKIREQALGPEHPDVAGSLDNLATLYKDQGRYAEAEPLYQRSLNIREQALGPEHADIAGTLNNLAYLYYSEGRYAEAEPLAERAAAVWDKSGAAPGSRFIGYNVKSKIAWKLGKRAHAIEALEAALSLAESQRVQAAGGEQQRAQLFAKFGMAYEHMVGWQRELGDVAQAFATVERCRARALLDQLSTSSVDLLAGVPEARAKELRQLEATAKTTVASLEKEFDLLRARKDLDATSRKEQGEYLAKKLVAAQQALIDAFIAIRNASPAYRQMIGQDFKPAGLEQVQTRLAGPDGLLLEYFLGSETGYVVAVPPTGQKTRIESLRIDESQAKLLGVEAGPLTSERMRQVMTNADGTGVLQLLRQPGNSVSASAKLAALWQVLVPKAERNQLTTDRLKRLTVIPDGMLSMLPFETLVVGEGDHPRYLLDAGPPIVNTPSSTLLLNLTEAKSTGTSKGKKPVLSVGDPTYAPATLSADDSSHGIPTPRSRYVTAHGQLQALPFSGTESTWVADVFRQQGIDAGTLQQRSAREASVRTYAPGRGVLHFACHGLVDQSYGNLFGALALTPGPEVAAHPEDDGFLTLAEIYGLHLQGTELSILSACDTNFGPEQKGEGVWSLSRGFLVAGSRRVVASNWLVDDEAAASLISVYCGAIAKGEKAGKVDYAEALRAAKRWVHNQDKWSSPYYWGTFVLVGPN